MGNKYYYTYILTNDYGNVLYVGVTNDLVRRSYEHKHKLVDGFTKKYNISKLVYYEQYEEVGAAIAREKQIKGWTRAKKNALVESVNPMWQDVTEQIMVV